MILKNLLSKFSVDFYKIYILCRDTLRECSTIQTKLGNELSEYCNEVEKTVLKPISNVLDVSLMRFFN